jgi:hypothetical protein
MDYGDLNRKARRCGAAYSYMYPWSIRFQHKHNNNCHYPPWPLRVYVRWLDGFPGTGSGHDSQCPARKGVLACAFAPEKELYFYKTGAVSDTQRDRSGGLQGRGSGWQKEKRTTSKRRNAMKRPEQRTSVDRNYLEDLSLTNQAGKPARRALIMK